MGVSATAHGNMDKLNKAVVARLGLKSTKESRTAWSVSTTTKIEVPLALRSTLKPNEKKACRHISEYIRGEKLFRAGKVTAEIS